MSDVEKINQLKQAISRLWRTLPELVGGDWSTFARDLELLLNRLATTNNPIEDKSIYNKIRLLFFDHEQANDRLVQLLNEADATTHPPTKGLESLRGGTTITGDVNVGGDFVGRDQIIYNAPNPAVTRYSDILAPSCVPVKQRFPLIVGLTCLPNPDSRDAQPLAVQPGQTIQIMLTSSAELTVIGARLKPLVVLAAADSEPAVFYLTAQQAGDHRVQIDFWSAGQVVATSIQAIGAVEKAEMITNSQATTQPLALEAKQVAYPDLIMRISTIDNRLRFDLSYADIDFKHFEGERLRSDPEQFRRELIEEIESLTTQPHEVADFVVRELGKIGQRLYRELWPAELRREYRHLRKVVRTFQIISDEPWIPWELLKPYDSAEPQDRVDDDFLCMQFDFARWFTPARPPAQQFLVRSLAAISPDDTDLSAVLDEQRMVRKLAVQHGWQDHTPVAASKRAVEQLLSGEVPIDLWHFASHGNFKPAMPDRSPLRLQGQTELQPDDLVGPAEDRLRADRPLVFLNACRVGASGLSLTGLGGWAKVLIQNCGVAF